MSRTTNLVPWLSEIELLEWVRQAEARSDYQKRLAVWLTHLYHFPAHQIATMLGVSTQAVWLWLGQYNRQGPERLNRPGRGGRRWGFLSLEQEDELLTMFRDHAQSGKVLTARQLHAQVNRAVGREVSLAYVYRLLHRHDWRKLGPRPRHVKADPAVQEAFKKTSRTSSRKH
jgi:transposase